MLDAEDKARQYAELESRIQALETELARARSSSAEEISTARREADEAKASLSHMKSRIRDLLSDD